jgi:RHS repeat-associated protein
MRKRDELSAKRKTGRRVGSYALAVFAVAFFSNVALVAPTPQSEEPPAPPPGATEEWSAAARQAVAESEYEVSRKEAPSAREEAYQAPNRAHNFRSHFSRDALRLVPRTDEGAQWELSLSLVGYGRGDDVRPIDSPTLEPRGKRIDYRRGQLTEWYVNDERGLEQGFMLSVPPEAMGRGAAIRRVPGSRARTSDDAAATEPAFVVLRLGGDLVPTISPDGQAIDFAPRSGGLSVMRYSKLLVIDARGNELPSWMEGFSEDGGRGIRLVFDDTDAAYPVTVDPLATNASWTGEVNREAAAFGWSVAGAGDINGDGFDDVVVGAPFFDLDGPASGSLFYFLGSPTGLSTDPALPLNTSGLGVGTLAGFSVASAGDFNGDGFDDVIVSWVGRPLAIIYYGSLDGLSESGDTRTVLIPSPIQPTGFAHSIAGAGDINQDGYDDVVIGAPFFDCVSPPLEDCGKVHVYYGEPAAGLIVNTNGDWSYEGTSAGAQLGWTVAGGDVGSTSHSDLIVSAPGSDTGPIDGEVLVFLGSASGPSSSPDRTLGSLAPKPDLFLCSVSTVACKVDLDCRPPAVGGSCPGCSDTETCDNAARVNFSGHPARETFRDLAMLSGGTLVAATGDVNGDGIEDWAVGSPYEGGDAGRVDVYFGTTDPVLPTMPAWSTSGTSPELLGWSVAGAGDTNGDGFDELLIGSPGLDNGATGEGGVAVHPGSIDGPTDEPIWTAEGNQFYAAFGYSLDSAGDVNGDGLADVIVGAVNGNRGQALEGIVSVFLGAEGLTPLAIGDALGFNVTYTRGELQDFADGVLSPQLNDAAIGFGPSPGSLLLSTGRATDLGLGDTDWGGNAADTTVFEMTAAVPADKKTFCFSSQFVTSESDPSTDKAFFCFEREGGFCSSPTYELSALATGERNAPIGHCIDVEGKTSLFLRFEVRDGNSNGSNDSGLILSRLYLSELPLPADVLDETTDDGYFQNPAPLDISRLAGTYAFSKTLFSVPGATMPFELTVSYDSASTEDGRLGPKWSHSYDGFAVRSADSDDDGALPDTIRVKAGGRVEYFNETPEGLYEPSFTNGASSLTYDPAGNGTVTYVTRDRMTRVFSFLDNDPDVAATFQRLYMVSTEDANGGRLDMTYGGTPARLENIVDTRGKTFAFDYNPGGLLEAVRSDPGTATEAAVLIGYDSGRLESLSDLDGNSTTFTTTLDGKILEAINGDGVTFVSNQYERFDSIALDQQGDRIALDRDSRDLLDPDAGLQLVYDGDTIVVTDRLLREQRRQYDLKGRVAAEVDRTGVRTEYGFDRDDNRIEARRRLPSESVAVITEQSIYDERGNPLSQVQFPSVCISTGQSCEQDDDCPGSTCGVSGAMTYDQDNNLRSVADHYGNRVIYDYDVNGNVIRQGDPLANESHFEYGTIPGTSTILPEPTALTNPRGFTTTREYDANGYLIATTDPTGARTTFTQDSRGRRTSVTDALAETDPLGGHSTCMDYNEVGRMVAVRALCGSNGEFIQRSLGYDAEGRVVRDTGADGATTLSEYTSTGQIATETNPLGHTTLYAYDAEDRLVNVDKPSPAAQPGATGGLRVITAISYDDGDRLTGVTGAPGVTANATYDEIGNLVEVEDPNGNVQVFAYDLLGRLMAQGPEDTGIPGTIDPNRLETTTYDGRNLTTSITTPRGDTLDYSYDLAGRITGIDFGSSSIAHVLDENGNRVLTTYDGSTVSRTFDSLDRLSSRTDEFGNQVDVVRDPVGRIIELIYPSDLDGDGERDRVFYGYDALNRLTDVLTDWDARSTTYRYDLTGRLVETTLPDGSVVSYSHDAAGNLTGISDPGGEFHGSYTLNAAGSRIAADHSLPLDPVFALSDVTYTYGPRNELLGSSTGAVYAYDDSGNMVTGTLDGVPVALGHNEIDQLVSVNGSAYRYDSDGFRVETQDSGAPRRYVYDMMADFPRLLEEQDADGNVIARYVHGIGLISRDGSEGFRTYHYDSRGSTVSLTDGGGEITDRYAYDPFGRLVDHAGSIDQPFRYNGRDGVSDDDNGLYYMRTRYYAPELQRFIERDQVFPGDLTDTQSLNRYAFVQGDPIQRVDPNGDWLTAITAVVGAAVSVGFECYDGCDVDEALGAAAEGAIAGATGTFLGAVAGALVGLAVQELTAETGEFLNEELGVDVDLGSGVDGFEEAAVRVGGAALFAGIGGAAGDALTSGITRGINRQLARQATQQAGRRVLSGVARQVIGRAVGQAVGAALSPLRNEAQDCALSSGECAERVKQTSSRFNP